MKSFFGYKPAILGFFLFITTTYPVSGFAGDKVKSLTENNVRAFVTDTAHMTTGQNRQLSDARIKTYLKKHLADDANFVSTITYNIPKMAPQTATISLTKQKFIESVGKGAESIEGYTNKVKVNEVDISFWGKKAFVKTENTETGFMPIPSESGHGEAVPIEGHSSCAQVITLEKGVIQMANAVCSTDITFKE